jgi:hypothetical protein
MISRFYEPQPWRCPGPNRCWGIPGIEPGTSRTRSEHNATIPNPRGGILSLDSQGFKYGGTFLFITQPAGTPGQQGQSGVAGERAKESRARGERWTAAHSRPPRRMTARRSHLHSGRPRASAPMMAVRACANNDGRGTSAWSARVSVFVRTTASNTSASNLRAPVFARTIRNDGGAKSASRIAVIKRCQGSLQAIWTNECAGGRCQRRRCHRIL